MIEKLYEIYSKNQCNFLLSPYSIHIALAMAREGARGVTLEQMNDVMGEGDPAVIKSDTLAIANAIWLRCDPKKVWKDIILSKYNGEAHDISALSVPERIINDWVYKHTKHKIEKILEEGSLKKDDKLVITNAVHFKDDWKYQFKEELTHKDNFYTKDGTVRVDMMKLRGHEDRRMLYGETDNLQVLEMRYETGSGNVNDMIVMDILLPKRRDGRVSADDVTNVKKILHPASRSSRFRIVDVWLPKIKMECKYSLKGDLISMGMPIAFSDFADFSGMSTDPSIGPVPGLKIGDVLHKTYVDINEEGTEAAAVTAIVMRALCSSMAPIEERVTFKVDHPYTFIIRHLRTNTILFVGSVNDPSRL